MVVLTENLGYVLAGHGSNQVAALRRYWSRLVLLRLLLLSRHEVVEGSSDRVAFAHVETTSSDLRALRELAALSAWLEVVCSESLAFNPLSCRDG